MMRLSDLIPGESDCLRVASDGGQPANCGLLWRHDGPCVPFIPGDYLPPPLLHPLDALKAAHARCCPWCGNESSPPVAEAVTAFRGEHANWDRPSFEWQWAFWPCGHVVRTVPGGHDEAPAREAGA